MRASTAAGINNSLLPRGMQLMGISRWAFAGGAVREKASIWRLLDSR